MRPYLESKEGEIIKIVEFSQLSGRCVLNHWWNRDMMDNPPREFDKMCRALITYTLDFPVDMTQKGDSAMSIGDAVYNEFFKHIREFKGHKNDKGVLVVPDLSDEDKWVTNYAK